VARDWFSRSSCSIVACFLLAALSVLTVCSGGLEAPLAPTIEDAPCEIALIELISAYDKDSATADLAYKGKRLYLCSCIVEKVSRQTNQNFEESITVGEIKCMPKYFGMLDTITQGTIVDIIGDCHGMMFGYILFRNCWIKVVGGPTTAPSSY